jgi:hypothetical protein
MVVVRVFQQNASIKIRRSASEYSLSSGSRDVVVSHHAAFAFQAANLLYVLT